MARGREARGRVGGPEPPETKPTDPRSQSLELLEKIVEEVSSGLDPDDAATDVVVVMARRIQSLLERNWDLATLPERRVRIWWKPTDVHVRSAAAEDAETMALMRAEMPKPAMVQVRHLDPAGKWDVEKEFNA